MMKKILIIDEKNFSQICSAILEDEGHKTKMLKDVKGLLSKLNDEIGLIITSYPFGFLFFEDIKKMHIPSIVLADHINKDLINILEGFRNSYCMVKPLDYQKFRSLVKEIVSCDTPHAEGYNVL